MNIASLETVEQFLLPIIGLPAWGVKQGHGSFLTFEFGDPKLEVHEWQSNSKGVSRSAHVHGRWHLWIYCCHWRATQDGTKLAWSEDPSDLIGRAAARLNGQKLLAVEVDRDKGRSSFIFDLGCVLETWPYDDPTDEQWIFMTGETASFAYRADGLFTFPHH
jgi:hypothetical protein